MSPLVSDSGFWSSLATWLASYRMGNGPRTKSGRAMVGEMAGGTRQGSVPKMARQTARYAEHRQIVAVRPIAINCPATIQSFNFGLSVGDRRPFRWPFLGQFWFWARFPVCSRPAKTTFVIKVFWGCKPGRQGQKSNHLVWPKVLGEGSKVADIGAKGWLHWRNMGFHGRKPLVRLFSELSRERPS